MSKPSAKTKIPLSEAYPKLYFVMHHFPIPAMQEWFNLARDDVLLATPHLVSFLVGWLVGWCRVNRQLIVKWKQLS
jgi:hypothetical protein